MKHPSRILLPLFLFCTLLSALVAQGEESDKKPPFAVVGYVQVFRLDDLDTQPLGMLDELIYHGFRPLPDGTVQRNPFKDPNDWQLRSTFAEPRKFQLARIREQHPDLGIRFGVIGKNDEFGPVAADPAKRKKFAGELLALCREGEFVGVDLDYEYPTTPAERKDYDLLIEEVCRTLQPEGFSVTAALSHWNLPSPSAVKKLDRVHLMAYDKPKGHHSTYEDAVQQVEKLLEHGVEPAKLLLGLPFYGRSVEDYSKSKSQADLRAEVVPFPESEDMIGEWAINSIETLQRKVDHARQENLGGVMIWEVGQDVPGEATLLTAVREAADRD
jgi:GH18 family chitinase